MKYLELFEDHSTKTFWEIKDSEYVKDIYYGDEYELHVNDDEYMGVNQDHILSTWVDFTGSELSKLEKILGKYELLDFNEDEDFYDYSDDYGYSEPQEEYENIDHAYITFRNVAGLMDPNEISVAKTKDEWFYVHCYVRNSSPTHISYKCDQWDGLIDCLDYIKDKYKERYVDILGEKIINKLFEKHNQFFQQIQQREYIDSVWPETTDPNYEFRSDDARWENFTKKEFTIIKQKLRWWSRKGIVNNLKFRKQGDVGNGLITPECENAQICFRRGQKIYITITKLEDEWYYANFHNNSFFKCDQFDGLVACLETFESVNKIMDDFLKKYDD